MTGSSVTVDPAADPRNNAVLTKRSFASLMKPILRVPGVHNVHLTKTVDGFTSSGASATIATVSGLSMEDS